MVTAAAVGVLAAKLIPYVPNKPVVAQRLLYGKKVKISEELFEDKEVLKEIFEEQLKNFPPGYECISIEVGFEGPDEFGPGDLVSGMRTVVFKFYPKT